VLKANLASRLLELDIHVEYPVRNEENEEDSAVSDALVLVRFAESSSNKLISGLSGLSITVLGEAQSQEGRQYYPQQCSFMQP